MIKPTRGYLVVKAFEKETQSAFGIIIPGSVDEDKYEGIVISVGEGNITDKGEYITPVLKEGDIVLFGKYGCNPVKDNGEEFLLMKEENVFGVFRDEAVV